jgi:hypothetical protein
MTSNQIESSCQTTKSETLLQQAVWPAVGEGTTLDHESETIDLIVRNQKQDSRRVARSNLNVLFEQLHAWLTGRRNVYGRITAVVTESNSPEGDSPGSPSSPTLVGDELRRVQRGFIEDLCNCIGLPVRKLNSDFLTRPLLNFYDLQTSKTKFKRDHGKYTDEEFEEIVIERAINNIRNLTFSIFNCIYTIYDKLMDVSFFHRFIVEWFLIFLQGRFAKMWKLQTTILFCIATDQREPPEYSLDDIYPLRPGYLSGGKFYKFMRKCMRTSKCVPFFYSIMQTKRNTESLSWVKEYEALVKHRKNMQGAAFLGTKKQTIPGIKVDSEQWTLEDVEFPIMGATNDNVERAIGKIDSVISRNFGKKDHKYRFRYRPPAINSTFSHSRRACGAQGWFSQNLWDLRKVFVGYLEEGWKPVPIYAPRSIVMDICDFADYLHEQDRAWINEDLITTDATVHTVLEPLKARIITSGDAPTYHWARMVQRKVHGTLRKDKYMQLMGKPHTSEYFREKFVGKLVREGWNWVDGDYDAATDGMNPRGSLEFCKSIGEKLRMTKLEIKRYQSTMCGHQIHYPAWTSLEPVRQIWGQLMGSPSSFPALCVMNLVGFWVALEIYLDREVEYDEIEEYCTQINGDDIAFLSNDELYKIWKDVMTDLGLTPSIGKNFRAENWFMINSTCYWVEYWTMETLQAAMHAETTDEETFEILLKYWGRLRTELIEFGRTSRIVKDITDMQHIDPGLIAGISKVQSDTRLEEMDELDKDAQLFAMCAKLRKSIEHKDDDLKERMTDCFHYHCGKALSASKRSWTLPVTLGGLGLPGDCNKSTKLQKLVALKIAGTGLFPEIVKLVKDERDLERIQSYIKLDAPQTEKGNAVPAYLLPSRLRNDQTKDYKGFPVPDFSHLELSNQREMTEGAIFERCLRKASKSVEAINLDFLEKLDFNRLKDFKFVNEESRVSIRPSFRYRVKWDPKVPSELRRECLFADKIWYTNGDGSIDHTEFEFQVAQKQEISLTPLPDCMEGWRMFISEDGRTQEWIPV